MRSRHLGGCRQVVPVMLLVLGTGTLAAEQRPDSVDLEGVVLDARTGESIRGALVFLPSIERSMRTDGSGEFGEVRVPAGLVEIAISHEAYELFHGQLFVSEDREVSLELTSLDEERSLDGAVRGEITDALTGDPVPFASIEVLGTDASELSDEEGRWYLRSVPSQTPVLLVAKHLGYAPETRTVTVPPDSVLEVAFRVEERVIPLEGIDVAVTNKILSTAGFYRRAGRAYNGRQWTVQDIAQADPDNIDDLLIDVRGLQQMGSDGHWDAVGCDTLPVFINEMEVPPDYNLDMIDPDGVAGMEVYHGLRDIEVPTGYGCGAILIWLRPPPARQEPQAGSRR